MKKRLSLLLAIVMIITMIPMTAFAASTNSITSTATAAKDAILPAATAPRLVIKNAGQVATGALTFQLDLAGAEWAVPVNAAGVYTPGSGTYLAVGAAAVDITAAVGLNQTAAPVPATAVTIQLLTASSAIISINDINWPIGNTSDFFTVPMLAKLTTEGQATVTIDPLGSVLSAGTYAFANVATGATTTTVEKAVDTSETAVAIKPIVISEVTAGSISLGQLRLRLSSGFKYNLAATAAALVVTSTGTLTGAYNAVTSDTSDLYITIGGAVTTTASKLAISGIFVEVDDASAGSTAEITVSGCDVTKQTVTVATAVEYGVKLTAADKELPQFIAGRDVLDNETLKVTFQENIANSWFSTRKTQFVFADGIKIRDIDVKTNTGFATLPLGAYVAGSGTISNNKWTLPVGATTAKAKIEVVFTLAVAPRFEGEVEVTVTGAGVPDDLSVVVAEVIPPVTVTAEVSEVSIDYRKVAAGDITIKENVAGALEKNKVLSLALDIINFEGTPSFEVTEGDLKIDTVTQNGGNIDIAIKSASSKTASTIVLSDLELYLDRTLPAGDYALSVVGVAADNGNAWIQNASVDSARATLTNTLTGAAANALVNAAGTAGKAFNQRSVEVAPTYVKVVTAGRDQDDSTFTTKIEVTIGSNEIKAGETVIQLDVPAYISNGYTMMPVRAVTEALSKAAIVRWDDASKTVIITFGQRIISMTVGKSTMNINGVEIAMQAAVEITDSRAFIPLRDLGYALGLNDEKISWDDATKTASLN